MPHWVKVLLWSFGGVIVLIVAIVVALFTFFVQTSEKVVRETEREIERQTVESSPQAIYLKTKTWYGQQLEYNDLTESDFSVRESDALYMLTLWSQSGGGSVNISYSEKTDWFSWPQSMAKGYALELIKARMIIYAYEKQKK